jgi:gliding motility-associated-like protein
MRKYLIILFVLSFSLTGFSQVFWTEDFGIGCNQGQLATSVTSANGTWAIVSTGTNGTYANTWYISATENGNPAGSCGSGCGTDRTLHLGNVNIMGLISADGGASYYAGGLGGEETNRRAESPAINCTGYSTITLDFVYMEYGDGSLDNATLWYYDGLTWSLLIDLPKTPFGSCSPQGQWTAYSIAMPVSANNNANVKIAFNWTNNTDASGTDPSFAVDDITLSVPSSPSPPIASFTTSATTICEGDSIVFTDNSISSTTINAWAWTFNGGTPASANTQGPHTVVFNAAGNHNIVLQVTDPNGTDDTTIVITVNAAYDATITAAGPFCVGDPFVFLSAVDPGGTWSGTGVNATTGEFNPTTAGVGTHQIIYTISGSCGDADTIDIIVNTSFDATITAVGPFCVGDPSVFLLAVDPGGTWSGTGVNATTGEFAPVIAGAGTHQIIYTISGSCGDADTINILVNTSFDASITAAGPFCVGDPSVFLSAVDPGGTWNGTGVNATTGEFNPTTAGVGTHQIIYTISGSCGDADTIDIIVNTSYDATITPAGSFCSNDSSFTLTAVDPGGTWSGTGVNVATGGFDPSLAGAGTHEIIYTITGSCGDADTINIIVNMSANASITAAGPFCVGDPSVILSAVDPGGTWSGTGVNASTGEFDPVIAGAGTHQIIYTISGLCGDADTITISVITQQDATILSQTPLCSNEPAVQLHAADPGGAWTGAGVNTTGLFTPSLAGAGTHQIIYTISGNCGDADTINILIYDSPKAIMGSTSESCNGEEDGIARIDSLYGGTQPYTILWTNIGGTGTIPNDTTYISPVAPGSYTVVISDANGCTLNTSVIVDGSLEDCYTSEIYIPNIFSPNGDGNNDVLYVYGHGIKVFDFKIYDRWGEKIFESKTQTIGWDGTYKNTKLDPAVFTYFFKAEFENSESIKLTGNITLIK